MRAMSVFIFFFYASICHSLEIDDNFAYQKQLTYTYVLDDTKNIRELINKDLEWLPEKNKVLDLGHTSQPLWMKISLKNKSKNNKDLILSIDNILIDKVTAYIERQDQSIVTLSLGDALPLIQRPIKHEAQLVPIQLLAQQQSNIYLSIEHHGPVNVPLSLWHPIEYIKYKSKFNLIYGIFAGFIIALALMHLTLFSFTKKHYFLYAAAFITTLWLLNIHLYGFSYRYLYGNVQWLQQYAQPILIVLSSSILMLLIKPYLKSNRLQRFLLLPASYFYTTVGIIIVGLCILPIHISVAVGYLISLSLVCVLLTIFVIQWLLHKHKIRGCIMMFAFLIIALVHQISFEIGAVSGPQLNTPITYFCYFAVSLIVSFILSRQFITERDQDVKAQQAQLAYRQAQDVLLNEKLKLQAQTQADLEAQVDERTFELQVALRELEEKNRELEQMNIEDSLTKVKNRRYFDKRLQMEVRRSRREQSPLSVVMLDIDHFKSINDTYGHLSGDKAICAVADIIKAQIQRPSDEVFRYGGEEFVMLLPNTELEGAQQVAESIRLIVNQTQLELENSDVNMTLSAGIYSAIALDPKSPYIYTDFADKALYEAKQQGRNQVKTYQP